MGKKRTCIKGTLKQVKQSIQTKPSKDKKVRKASPYKELNQSIKSNISSIYTLTQFQKVYKKANLIA